MRSNRLSPETQATTIVPQENVLLAPTEQGDPVKDLKDSSESSDESLNIPTKVLDAFHKHIHSFVSQRCVTQATSTSNSVSW